MNEPACHYCGVTQPAEGEPFDKDRELRPYGPGGATVCHPCAFATAERRAQTEAAYVALLGAAEAASPLGVAAIGTPDGPMPVRLQDDTPA